MYLFLSYQSSYRDMMTEQYTKCSEGGPRTRSQGVSSILGKRFSSQSCKEHGYLSVVVPIRWLRQLNKHFDTLSLGSLKSHSLIGIAECLLKQRVSMDPHCHGWEGDRINQGEVLLCYDQSVAFSKMSWKNLYSYNK
jgi:hypothetical protein